jgi:hypothetical protein
MFTESHPIIKTSDANLYDDDAKYKIVLTIAYQGTA